MTRKDDLTYKLWVCSERLFCSQKLYQMLVLKIFGTTNSNNKQIFLISFLTTNIFLTQIWLLNEINDY